MWKKISSTRFWKYVTAFMLPLLVIFSLNQSVDNDTYFVLAEGRQIVEHGIYYTDELSMHSDFEVTVHNYGFAVMYWLIYSVFGAGGLYVAMIILNIILMFLLYKICMLLSNKNENLSLLLMMATDILMALGYIVTRGQMISYIILVAVIYVLELYIRREKTKYLIWIPFLSLMAINLRAASWIEIFLVLAAYIVGAVKIPKLHQRGYKWKPLLVTSVIALIVGLLNPYGIKMITFIFTSYGISDFTFINEMKAFNPMKGWNLMYYFCLVGAMILYMVCKRERIRIRYLLLLFGFLFTGLNAIKAMADVILVAWFPFADIYRDWRVPKIFYLRIVQDAFITWIGIFALAIGVAASIGISVLIEVAPRGELISAVDMIDEDIRVKNDRTNDEKIEKADLKIYTGYDDGGYLEFRNYKPYLDPRAEVFIMRNNGKRNVMREWLDFREGKLATEEFLAKYDFDYLVVTSNERIYDLNNEKYEIIYDSGCKYEKPKYDEKLKDEDEDDNVCGEVGVRVYRKVMV